MHQKMQQRLLGAISPYFVKIVKDGIEAGIMRTDCPEEVVEMSWLYANEAFDDTIEYSQEEKMHKVMAFIGNVELMLCMEQGSMSEAMMPMFYRR